MADEYQCPLTKELAEMADLRGVQEKIVDLLVALKDGDELISTPMMDEFVYGHAVHRGMVVGLCKQAFQHPDATPIGRARLLIAIVNAERRQLVPDMKNIERWMDQAAGILDGMDSLDAPGARRTLVLFHYNAALLCRLEGDFEGETGHHREISKIAQDEFSRNNAAYMAEFAEMLHRIKAGTVHAADWPNFRNLSDRYRSRLREEVPLEAQWLTNIWSHRAQLAILLKRIQVDEGWVVRDVSELLASDIPHSSKYAANLLAVCGLLCHRSVDGYIGNYANDTLVRCIMRATIESILNDAGAGDEWRMLATLLKAHISGEESDYRAVTQMPGNGICHAARAVAERMFAA